MLFQELLVMASDPPAFLTPLYQEFLPHHPLPQKHSREKEGDEVEEEKEGEKGKEKDLV